MRDDGPQAWLEWAVLALVIALVWVGVPPGVGG